MYVIQILQNLFVVYIDIITITITNRLVRVGSKVKSHMNWWIKCILAVIAKTASRNVAFKARKVRDSIMEDQDRFIMRELDDAEVGLGEDCEEASADVGSNADLYVANQESADLISDQ